MSSRRFGIFVMFWTALDLSLSEAPFNYSPLKIGTLGLFGLAGAVAAQYTGNLHDRGWWMAATGAGWGVALLALLVAALAQHSLILIVIAIVLLHFAISRLNVIRKVMTLVAK